MMAGRKYKTEDDLPSELCCPVCFHIHAEEVYHCKNSHSDIVCGKCLKKTPKLEGEDDPRCSICRVILARRNLIRCTNLEKILNPLKLDCSFNKKGCQEIQMERKVLRKHQDYCYYNPENGPAVRFCQLLFHPDCDFGITSGTGKLGVEHFRIHKSIIKKSTKFKIQQNKIQNAEKDTSVPFWTPIFVEIEEEKCNVLISVFSDPTNNSLGFISFLIPFRNKKNPNQSLKPSPIQVEFSISNGPAKKSNYSFIQVPIIISQAEETILQILREPLPPPRKLQSSTGGQPSGSGKGMKIAVNIKQIQPGEPQRPARLEMFTSDAKIVNQNKKVPSSSLQPKNPQKNKSKKKKALTGLSSLPLFSSGLILLLAIGAIYLGNLFWQGDSGDLAVNTEQKVSSKDRVHLHHQNKYLPKDENEDFKDMTPAEISNLQDMSHVKNLFVPKDENGSLMKLSPEEKQTTLFEMLNAVIPTGSLKQNDNDPIHRFITVSDEFTDAWLHVLNADQINDTNRPPSKAALAKAIKKLIAEFELHPKVKKHSRRFISSKAKAKYQDELEQRDKKEKNAINRLLNALIMPNQELAFDKIKTLFGNKVFADLNPQILPNLLSLVCVHNTAKIVKLFVGQGFPLNMFYNGRTPLHYAILNKNEALEICKVLLEHGADCNLKTGSTGQTPLQFSVDVLRKDVEFLSQLISLYVEYNPSCTQPSEVADKSYFESSLKNQKLPSDQLNTLIMTVARYATWDGVKYLLEEAGVEEINVNLLTCGEMCPWIKDTLIHDIFITDFNKTRAFEKIKFLVEEKGADLHPRLELDLTYLHLAAEFGTGEVVEYFLNKGLDVNAKESSGKSPLLASLGNKDVKEGLKIGSILLKNKANCEHYIGESFTEENLRKLKSKLDILYETYKPACLQKNL